MSFKFRFISQFKIINAKLLNNYITVFKENHFLSNHCSFNLLYINYIKLNHFFHKYLQTKQELQ